MREPIDAATVTDKQRFLKMDGRPVFKWAVRLVADKMQASLNQSVVIENRTGGAGRIGPVPLGESE